MLWYSWQDVTTDQVLQPLNCRGPDKMPKRTDQAESTNGSTLVQDPCKGKGIGTVPGNHNSRARSWVRLSSSRCQASPVQRGDIEEDGTVEDIPWHRNDWPTGLELPKGGYGLLAQHGLWQYCTFFHEERSSEDIHLGRIACTAKVWRPM